MALGLLPSFYRGENVREFFSILSGNIYDNGYAVTCENNTPCTNEEWADILQHECDDFVSCMLFGGAEFNLENVQKAALETGCVVTDMYTISELSPKVKRIEICNKNTPFQYQPTASDRFSQDFCPNDDCKPTNTPQEPIEIPDPDACPQEYKGGYCFERDCDSGVFREYNPLMCPNSVVIVIDSTQSSCDLPEITTCDLPPVILCGGESIPCVDGEIQCFTETVPLKFENSFGYSIPIDCGFSHCAIEALAPFGTKISYLII